MSPETKARVRKASAAEAEAAAAAWKEHAARMAERREAKASAAAAALDARAAAAPARLHANLSRLDEMARQAAKRWAYMASTRDALEACGIETVPLFYEMLEDEPRAYQAALAEALRGVARVARRSCAAARVDAVSLNPRSR